MEILRYPQRLQWDELCQRAMASEASEVKIIVADIIENVRRKGDEALFEFEQRFTGASLESLMLQKKKLRVHVVPSPINYAMR